LASSSPSAALRLCGNTSSSPSSSRRRGGKVIAGLVIVILVAAVVALLGLLATSIMQRRWEAQRPSIVLQPMPQWATDSNDWSVNYSREHDTYLLQQDSTTRTLYGGSFPRNYLQADPRQVVLFAGYGFSKDYRQARGHVHAVEDVAATKRVKPGFNAATCWTCKSPDVPRMMAKMGVAQFYAANFHDLKKDITHPIGCLDCHDPNTMALRITRPALKEAFAAMGKDITKATHQEMRSLVCAQCHVEYYFKAEPKNYLAFPWAKGTTVDAAYEYYQDANFSDWTHAVSGTRMVKAQHPDYEIWSTGVHAYRNVSCADCHMPYRSEGGQKFTNHHVQSPLLDIANSCGVCHRWSEQEIRARVEAIQNKVADARGRAEEALVAAHFDVAAAVQAGASDAELADARALLRRGQFYWDYVSASNGIGFHSPQESMRILGQATDDAQKARLLCARILAAHGILKAPNHPDTSTREKAWSVNESFVEKKPPRLLP
jgi:nitrite reductase (cytochrome c-552)